MCHSFDQACKFLSLIGHVVWMKLSLDDYAMPFFQYHGSVRTKANPVSLKSMRNEKPCLKICTHDHTKWCAVNGTIVHFASTCTVKYSLKILFHWTVLLVTGNIKHFQITISTRSCMFITFRKDFKFTLLLSHDWKVNMVFRFFI